MITLLNCGTSIDAITENSGVQRQFLGVNRSGQRHASMGSLICFTWKISPWKRRFRLWKSSLLVSMMNLLCVIKHHDQSCLVCLEVRLPHIQHAGKIHEGTDALVVKSFTPKEKRPEHTLLAIDNLQMVDIVYPSFNMMLYLGFIVGTSFYFFLVD